MQRMPSRVSLALAAPAFVNGEASWGQDLRRSTTLHVFSGRKLKHGAVPPVKTESAKLPSATMVGALASHLRGHAEAVTAEECSDVLIPAEVHGSHASLDVEAMDQVDSEELPVLRVQIETAEWIDGHGHTAGAHASFLVAHHHPVAIGFSTAVRASVRVGAHKRLQFAASRIAQPERLSASRAYLRHASQNIFGDETAARKTFHPLSVGHQLYMRRQCSKAGFFTGIRSEIRNGDAVVRLVSGMGFDIIESKSGFKLEFAVLAILAIVVVVGRLLQEELPHAGEQRRRAPRGLRRGDSGGSHGRRRIHENRSVDSGSRAGHSCFAFAAGCARR